ncbi:40S ribosomal protein S4-3 [Zea mays]|uniref:40S ribosomal protein S4-3 n=1 Tax=Zea mays TaxID=4577 RepID=A0A1D6FMP1_MAIZE|nr:40S ribosomal protein S4-3 [Zea mays]AQK92986.1 40S ribosomal protein S4-3 [Zea mays]AQK93013.1 40S ribosomal protein S4-3 [Zea mays]
MINSKCVIVMGSKLASVCSYKYNYSFVFYTSSLVNCYTSSLVNFQRSSELFRVPCLFTNHPLCQSSLKIRFPHRLPFVSKSALLGDSEFVLDAKVPCWLWRGQLKVGGLTMFVVFDMLYGCSDVYQWWVKIATRLI